MTNSASSMTIDSMLTKPLQAAALALLLAPA